MCRYFPMQSYPFPMETVAIGAGNTTEVIQSNFSHMPNIICMI